MTTPPTNGGPAGAGHAGDETLALYALRGEEVDATSAAHIAQCPACQREAAQFASLHRDVGRRLHRLTCPPEETLSAFALDELTDADRREIAMHLQECRRCAEEVRATWLFLAGTDGDIAAIHAWEARAAAPGARVGATPSGPGPMEALRRVLARLVPGGPSLNPAFRVMGSSAEEGEALQAFDAEGLRIVLQQAEDRGTHVVTGMIHPEPDRTDGPQALLARLVRGDGQSPGEAGTSVVAESAIARDAFEFSGVAAGTYRIELLFPDRLVVVAPVTLGRA